MKSEGADQMMTVANTAAYPRVRLGWRWWVASEEGINFDFERLICSPTND